MISYNKKFYRIIKNYYFHKYIYKFQLIIILYKNLLFNKYIKQKNHLLHKQRN